MIKKFNSRLWSNLNFLQNPVVKAMGFLVLALGIFLSSSCTKLENIESSSHYNRSDVVAVEAALYLVNSSAMATENYFPNATCDLSSTYKSCEVDPHDSNYFMSEIIWNTCTFNAGTIQSNGRWEESHQDNATINQCAIPVPVGLSVVRRVKDGEFIRYTMPNQDTVELNTISNPALGVLNYGVTVKRDNATTRTISVDSLHMVRKSNESHVLYDVYLSTASQSTFDITISKALNADNERTVSTTGTGLYVSFNNGEKVKASFNAVKWEKDPTMTACCYPRSGQMTLDFLTGSNQGKTATVTFSPSCGSGVITGVNGQINAIHFSECF